jgi:hypothetical protein
VAWVVVVQAAPGPLGIVGPMVAALAAVAGVGRLNRALSVNHRYRFTTWRWGRLIGAMFVMGLTLKLATG